MRVDVSTDDVVVVGAGLAGLRTCEQLRARGFTGRLMLVGAESHPPYDRPPLSKQVLRGEREVTWLRAESAYSELDLELRLGTPASGLDTDAKLLRTDHGDIAYGQLVIATGARARRLPGAPGLALRTLDDAVALRERLTQGSRLTIVGAGLVGCEVAASARALGVEVDLIDVLPAPLVRVLGPVVAARIADLHASHGVRMHLAAGAHTVTSTEHEVALADGSAWWHDTLLESMGALPDTDWLRDSGVDLDDGVLCDAEGRTRTPGIFAVGDVARWDGRRVEHWTSAGEQAAIAAVAMLRQEEPTVPRVPYWWSDQYDVKLQGLGSVSADDDVVVVEVGPWARPLAVYSSGGRLTGVVGFSAAAVVMRLRSAVLEGSPVGEVLAGLRA